MSQDTVTKPDIVICGPNNPDLAKLWSSRGGWEQSNDEPIYVVIGSETSDRKCHDLASRFDLNAAELVAFRDGGSRGVYTIKAR